MRDKPWYCIPLIDTNGRRYDFATRLEAESFAAASGSNEAYTIQYRPGRKTKR